MIIKQNCFVISECEQKAVLGGYYQHKKQFNNEGILVDVETSFNGSSLQRSRPVIYEPSIIRNTVSQKFVPNNKHLKKPGFSDEPIEHFFSKKSKIKIANKMVAWTRANKAVGHKGLYNFITLTLTSKQIGSDKDFTKMLNTFFTYCRKYYNIKNYLYVLERQNRTTNNIHAHIIIDRYVNYEHVNKSWCKILGENGYTFPQKNWDTGEIDTVSTWTALKRYSDKSLCSVYRGEQTYLNPRTGKPVKPTRTLSKPNPCDIQSIFNLKTVARYITKYVTKNDSKIYTSLWNCSQTISRLWTGAVVNANDYYGRLITETSANIRLTLDNGYVLIVNLLKEYTEIQRKIFAVNKEILLQKGKYILD